MEGLCFTCIQYMKGLTAELMLLAPQGFPEHENSNLYCLLTIVTVRGDLYTYVGIIRLILSQLYVCMYSNLYAGE